MIQISGLLYKNQFIVMSYLQLHEHPRLFHNQATINDSNTSNIWCIQTLVSQMSASVIQSRQGFFYRFQAVLSMSCWFANFLWVFYYILQLYDIL